MFKNRLKVFKELLNDLEYFANARALSKYFQETIENVQQSITNIKQYNENVK